MSSLASKLDLINDHFASCSRCKENAELNLCDILGDSGASQNFTNELKDFTEYEEIKNGPCKILDMKAQHLYGKRLRCYEVSTAIYTRYSVDY